MIEMCYIALKSSNSGIIRFGDVQKVDLNQQFSPLSYSYPKLIRTKRFTLT